MERVLRVAELDRRVRVRAAQLEVRVEDDPRAAARREAHRLGVPPALVTDHDAERERPDREDAARSGGRVGLVLRRIQLHLVLKAEPPAVRRDHERGRVERLPLDALGAEDDADFRLCRGRRDPRPGALEEHRVRRRRRLPETAVAGDVALREADDRRAGFRGARDERRHDLNRLLRRRRVRRGREGDADRAPAHGSARR